jgi:hypothetical protein
VIYIKINFCCFANYKYFNAQRVLIEKAQMDGFDSIFAYTDKDIIGTEFYKENKEILNLDRGAGYWLWKPYLILKTLKEMNDGDVLFYLDSGDTILKGTRSFISRMVLEGNDKIISTSFFSQKAYTKRDCFVFMNCDGPKYWDSHQVEAGIIAFQKTSENIKFLEEWFEFCKNKYIVTDLPNTSGFKNFDEFIDHRHDQSILTNLCVKYGVKLVNKIRKYAGVNVDDIMRYPVNRESSFTSVDTIL